MPRPLDVPRRKADISRIALGILAHTGPSGLTIRAVADELGGSVTKVTHIYPTRAELMRGMVDYYTEEAAQAAVAETVGKEPEDRLRALLEDMAPIDEESLRRERSRVALTSDRDQEAAQVFADSMEQFARERFRASVAGLVEEARVEDAVDFCRALVNGLVLSAVEHPDLWTPDRQRRVLEIGLAAIRAVAEGG